MKERSMIALRKIGPLWSTTKFCESQTEFQRAKRLNETERQFTVCFAVSASVAQKTVSQLFIHFSLLADCNSNYRAQDSLLFFGSVALSLFFFLSFSFFMAAR